MSKVGSSSTAFSQLAMASSLRPNIRMAPARPLYTEARVGSAAMAFSKYGMAFRAGSGSRVLRDILT